MLYLVGNPENRFSHDTAHFEMSSSIGEPVIDRVPVIDHFQVISIFIPLEYLMHIIFLSRLQVHSYIPQMKVRTSLNRASILHFSSS